MADAAQSLLSAMITPAVLLSGAGTLIMSTSTRLGRSTDRVRHLTARFKELASEKGRLEPLAAEEKRMIMHQLPRLSRRTRYLLRAMLAFYGAVACLVLTSVLLGISGLTGLKLGLLSVLPTLVGSCFLAYGGLLLSYETRLSAKTTRVEMRFLERLGQHYADLYEDIDTFKLFTTRD